MSPLQVLGNIRQGILQHPTKALFSTYVWVAGVYTLLSLLSFFVPVLQPDSTTWRGILILLGIFLISGTVAAYREADPSRLRFYVPAIATTIEVYFGDVFEAEGAKVIAANEYFDSELGRRVAPNSLHGQLIRRYFSSQSRAFEELVDRSLDDQCVEENLCRGQRTKRYPIGTTAVIEAYGQQFFLPALTKTDIRTNKASCDISLFGSAMGGLWNTIRNRVQGEPVNVPLIGSGQAQISLPPQQLLQLIIMTIVEASKPKITNEIRIVLPYAYRSKIDLNIIERNWSGHGLS